MHLLNGAGDGGVVAKAFKSFLDCVPTVLVLDAGGTIRYRNRGWPGTAAIQRAVRLLRAGERAVLECEQSQLEEARMDVLHGPVPSTCPAPGTPSPLPPASPGGGPVPTPGPEPPPISHNSPPPRSLDAYEKGIGPKDERLGHGGGKPLLQPPHHGEGATR
ncbi:MAG: hypothetical protein ACYCW6_22730 [Candidatus Xenobia bacterium]